MASEQLGDPGKLPGRINNWLCEAQPAQQIGF